MTNRTRRANRQEEWDAALLTLILVLLLASLFDLFFSAPCDGYRRVGQSDAAFEESKKSFAELTWDKCAKGTPKSEKRLPELAIPSEMPSETVTETLETVTDLEALLTLYPLHPPTPVAL